AGISARETGPSTLNGVTIAVRTSPSTKESLRERVRELPEGEEDRLREGRIRLDRVEQDVHGGRRAHRQRQLAEPLRRLRADGDGADEDALRRVGEDPDEAVALGPLVGREAGCRGQLPTGGDEPVAFRPADGG